MGHDSSVGIATRYGLDGPGIESVCVWGGGGFSAPVQTGRGAHPASHIIGTGSSPVVMRPGRGVDHPPQSSVEVMKGKGYTSTHPLGLSGLLEGEPFKGDSATWDEPLNYSHAVFFGPYYSIWCTMYSVNTPSGPQAACFTYTLIFSVLSYPNYLEGTTHGNHVLYTVQIP